MTSVNSKRGKACLYQAYFWISSKKPFGNLDWYIRRISGAIFNNATSAADMKMIRSLSASREAECPFSSKAPDPSAAEMPELDVIVLADQCHSLPELYQGLTSQNYPLQKISLTVITSRDISSPRFPELPGELGKSHYLQIPSNDIQSSYNKALGRTSSPYILLISCQRIPASTCLQMAVRSCLASPGDMAVWELSPTLTERKEYCEPVTLAIPNTSMSFAIMSRAAYNTAAGFDQSFPLSGQGLEMSYRLRAKGYRLQGIGHTEHFAGAAGQYSTPDPDAVRATLSLVRYRYGGLSDKLFARLFSGASSFSAAQDLPLPMQPQSAQATRDSGLRAKRDCSPSRLWRTPYEIKLGTVPATMQQPPAEQALVSIIIRTHAGRGSWLRQSICSVLRQTYQNLELIVVEDGSREHADNVNMFISNLSGPRTIKYLSQDKLGKSHAGNLGLAEARGEYCGFLDDDDLLFPAHIELLYNAVSSDALAAGAYALAWEAHTEVYADQSYREVYLEVAKHTQTSFDRDKLQEFNFLPIQSVLFNRKLYEKYGGFAPERQYLEDWELWQRYTQEHSFVYLPKITSKYRTPADPYERIARIRKRERRQVN